MSLEIADVVFWVKEALKSKNVYELEVFQHSQTLESANYQADLMFVTAEGIKTNGKKVTYELLVKMGKQNQELREQLPLRIIYEREIYVYRTVLPAYQNFEKEKGLEQFSLTPECYGTFLTVEPDQEVMVMENIQRSGFELHDRSKYFDENHIKLTLRAYAHWHAISLAIRDQRPEQFSELFDIACPFREYHNKKEFLILPNTINFTIDVLKSKNESKLLQAFNEKIDSNLLKVLNKISLDAETNESAVLVHGDCGRNNFMFKYKDNDTKKENPEKLAMLDFQMSTLSSPACDLAYLFYCVTPIEDIGNLEHYLETYHYFLSEKLKELGSNPLKIFPFSKLVEHWTKYSFIGVWSSLIVQFVLFDKLESDTNNNCNSDDKAKEIISTRVIGILNNWLFDLKL